MEFHNTLLGWLQREPIGILDFEPYFRYDFGQDRVLDRTSGYAKGEG